MEKSISLRIAVVRRDNRHRSFGHIPDFQFVFHVETTRPDHTVVIHYNTQENGYTGRGVEFCTRESIDMLTVE